MLLLLLACTGATPEKPSDDTGTPACVPADESCNGVDDDCDGEIDEGVTITVYADADGDGFGDATTGTLECAGLTDATDCDDTNALVSPAATEACNAVDDDCDTEVDEGTTITVYADADGDGFGDPDTAYEACDGLTDATDCDDTDGLVSPAETEACNGVDDDCDTEVDEGTTITVYVDADGDGFGDPYTAYEACDGLTDATDCDDTDGLVSPAATETCNGVDDDCDTEVDEGTTITVYADADGDGFGDAALPSSACDGLTDATDCDDTNALVSPASVETCNSVDDDCDTEIDEGTTITVYADADGDGFGDAAAPSSACDGLTDATDCDDTDAAINPGAIESCNSVDDNCDGDTDEGTTITVYADADGDGFGDAAAPSSACDGLTDATDCDDTNALVNPAAVETCNSVDDDCDTEIDEDTTVTVYADADGDGFGDAASPSSACDGLTDATDCDDGDAAVNPATIESCNSVDDDCDTEIDEDTTVAVYADADGDGFGDAAAPSSACDGVTDATDCDDGDAAINPGASETCNSVDDDCDGDTDEGTTLTVYADADGDGYGDPATAYEDCDGVTDATDCDDADPEVYPDATDTWGDGIDQDCDDLTDDTSSDDALASYTRGTSWDFVGWYMAAGDMNGDGTREVIVGTADTFSSYSGHVYVADGTQTGAVDLDTVQYWTAEWTGSHAGNALASGDLDGDGLDDVVVGAYAYRGTGAAYVLDGSTFGSSGRNALSTATARWTGVSYDYAGKDVAIVGDMDADGIQEVLVGAYVYDGPGTDSGAAYVVPGDMPSGTLASSTLLLEGEADSDRAGTTVSRVGDMDGDGAADLAVVAPRNDAGGTDAGAVYIVTSASGSTMNLASADAKLLGAPDEVVWRLDGGQDADGDGYDDLLVGGHWTGGYGAAYLVTGPTTGTLDLATDIPTRYLGDSTAYGLKSVAFVGDVDGDGDEGDFAIGACYAPDQQGLILVMTGDSSGTLDRSDAWSLILTTDDDGSQGARAIGMGDVDDDGKDDLLVGAAGTNSYRGMAYVVLSQ